MLQFVPDPETVIFQPEIRQYQTVSSERIDYYKERKVLLNILDFDAINTSDTIIQGVEVLQSDLMIAPHNFPGVHHLDLAGIYYKRSLLISQRPNRNNPRMLSSVEERFHYERMCVRSILISALIHIRYNPGQIARILRSFMEYARYTLGLGPDDMVPVTRFCLRALHETRHPDGNLVVQILMMYCRTQVHKEDLLDRSYTYDCLEYILESCRSVMFDIQYFLGHSERGRILGSCLMRTCVHSLLSHRNLPKMNVLVQYGFEPQELHGNMITAIFLGQKMLELMRRKGLHPLPNHQMHRFYSIDRRNDFIMELLYMVFASLGPFQAKWIECSTLFFNSVLDPLFCKDEVAEVLARLCHQEDHELALRQCNTVFGHLFVQIHTPRSLKHQARYVVRRLLKNNFQLPVGIEQLRIPDTLAPYLKLES